MSGRRFDSRRTGIRQRRGSVPPRFEALEGRQLLAIFTVSTTVDNGNNITPTPGSLRAAILNANASAQSDTIKFAIPGTGVHTIHPPVQLPTISATVDLDATTQPGFTGTPLIEIDGSNAGNAVNGLTITGGASEVHGLIIDGFSSSGIRIDASGVIIQGNFIGTNSNGTLARPNSGDGIFVNSTSSNIIGGDQPGQANVISGNGGAGVNLSSSGATGNRIIGNMIGVDVTGANPLGNSGNGITILDGGFNTVGGHLNGGTETPGALTGANVISSNSGSGILLQGGNARSNSIISNFIGTDSLGSKALPNSGDGILIVGAPGNVIGGTTPDKRNVISGNKGSGIAFTGGDNNTIRGNAIGTDAGGNANIGNAGAGIAINGANGTQIGGTLIGAGNIIAFNGAKNSKAGVDIFSGTGITIESNSIFSNGRLGIAFFSLDNLPSGVTPNHPNGSGNGPNNLENYPVLNTAGAGAGRTLVQGTLNSTPSSKILIQFFTNGVADPSGYGEGQTFIGQTYVQTDASGNATFSLTLNSPTKIGQFISATATDALGNTSTFAQSIPVTKANVADLGLTLTAAPSPVTINGNIVYTLTVLNSGPDPSTNVVVTDVLPPTATYVSSTTDHGTVSLQGSSVVAQLGNLAQGESAVITITATPTSVGTITDTATVSSSDIDPNTSNNSASIDTVVSIPSDVSVTVKAVPNGPAKSVITIDHSFVYLVTVTNNGPGQATGVNLDDLVTPAGMQILNVNSTQGSSSVVGQAIHVTLGNLAPGVPATIRIDVLPSQAITYTNKATVTLDQIDPKPENNTFSLDTAVAPAADLAVTMAGSADPLLQGGQLTYTIVVANKGPSDATGVTLTDTLPAGVTFLSADLNPANDVQTLTVSGSPTGGSLTIGGVNPLTTGAVSFSLANDATAAAAQAAAQVAFGAGNVQVTGGPLPSTPLLFTFVGALANQPVPALSITTNGLTGGTAPVTASFDHTTTGGGVLTVTPDPTTNVLTITGIQGTKTANTNPPTVPATIKAGDFAVVHIVVAAPSTSGKITNKAVISANEVDPLPANNTATLSTTTNPADLGVTIAASPTTGQIGLPLTLTVTVTNNGPATANNVILTDTLPAGLQPIVSPGLSQGALTGNSGGVVTANIGTLAAGVSATMTIVLLPNSSAFLTDAAAVKSDEIDSNSGNDTATLQVPISPADLGVSISAPDSAIVGDNLTYTLAVTNFGTTVATGVVLDDTLPSGLAFVSATGDSLVGGVAPLGSDIVAQIPTLPVGSTAFVTLVVKPSGPSTVVNTATVHGDQIDPATYNNSASATTNVVNFAGRVQFAQAQFNTGEKAHTATITVQRVGGTQGTIAVGYTATPGTAAAGVNFTPVFGLLTFNDGESVKTFTVPILDDGQVDGNHTVNLALSTDANGSNLGSPASAVLNVTEQDVDLNGPTVTDLQAQGGGRSITGLVISFNKALDASRAQDIGNYFIVSPPTRGSRGRSSQVGISSATYNPTQHTVTLAFDRAVTAGVFYQLAINGTSPSGVADRFGNLLSGAGTGAPGSNYIASFSRGTNLTYVDHTGNIVNLRLTGGGVIDLFRGSNGEAGVLHLLGTHPGRSTLSGSVRRGGPLSSGSTTLGQIDGLGAFGAVRSRLTTPPFVIRNSDQPQAITVSTTAVSRTARSFALKRTVHPHVTRAAHHH